VHNHYQIFCRVFANSTTQKIKCDTVSIDKHIIYKCDIFLSTSVKSWIRLDQRLSRAQYIPGFDSYRFMSIWRTLSNFLPPSFPYKIKLDPCLLRGSYLSDNSGPHQNCSLSLFCSRLSSRLANVWSLSVSIRESIIVIRIVLFRKVDFISSKFNLGIIFLTTEIPILILQCDDDVKMKINSLSFYEVYLFFFFNSDYSDFYSIARY